MTTLPTVSDETALAVTPGQMLQYAMDKGADLEKLEKLMDLQIKWEKEQARKAYYVAFAAFKASAPALIKNAEVDYRTKQGQRVHYQHETIDALSDIVAPALAKHGLSHGYDLEQEGKTITVTCTLSHEAGHSTSVSLSAGQDETNGKSQTQAIQSTITSLSRATLKAVTGLAPKAPDDATAVTVPHTTSPAEVNPLVAGELYEGKITVCEEGQTKERQSGWENARPDRPGRSRDVVLVPA